LAHHEQSVISHFVSVLFFYVKPSLLHTIRMDFATQKSRGEPLVLAIDAKDFWLEVSWTNSPLSKKLDLARHAQTVPPVRQFKHIDSSAGRHKGLVELHPKT